MTYKLGRKRWRTHILIEVRWNSCFRLDAIFAATSWVPLDAQRERQARMMLRKKGCWLGQETLADCGILHGSLELRYCQPAMTGSYFVFRYLIRGQFNVESLKSAYNCIPRGHAIFFPGLTLVRCWLCWAMGLSDKSQRAASQRLPQLLTLDLICCSPGVTQFNVEMSNRWNLKQRLAKTAT